MKKLLAILLLSFSFVASAAGLGQLFDSLKKPPTVTQPAPKPPVPQAPKSPTGK